jgi:hypothetical protein
VAPELYEPAAKDRLRELLSREQQLAREIEAAEQAWLEHSERLEELIRQAE